MPENLECCKICGQMHPTGECMKNRGGLIKRGALDEAIVSHPEENDLELELKKKQDDLRRLRYLDRLDKLKEKHRGQPMQQEALHVLRNHGNNDPEGVLRILDKLEAAGLTPGDVQEIYEPMYDVNQSQKSPEQRRLEEEIFGQSRYPHKKDDLEKVVNYVIRKKGK